MKLTSKITAEYKNRPIIDYLAGRYTYLSRELWIERIGEGRIEYEGCVVSAETIVKQGGEVIYDVPPFPQPDANYDYSILYEDEWLLAVNKPSNLRVHGEGRYMMANLIYQLRHVHEPPFTNIALANRLDADTSGVVMLAKDSETAKRMGQLFAEKQVYKQYFALVKGMPEPKVGVIDKAIGYTVTNPAIKKRGGRVPRCWADVPKVKEAVTEYEVLEQFRYPATANQQPVADYRLPITDHLSLVKLIPQTGRTHQLRVHMALLGCPLVGDRLYQLDDEEYIYYREHREDARYADLLPRQALHAAITRFTHPHTGKTLEVSAPLSADIQTLLDTLRTATIDNE